MVSMMAARWQRWGRWPLAFWLMLPLFGCGATLQAEDQATVAVVQGARKLYDAKEYQKARDKAAAALAKSPDNAQARYIRALAAIQLGDFAAARADLQQAKQLDPLLVFAESKEEFEEAWRVARDNTADALGGTVATPPPPDGAPNATPAPQPQPPKKIISKDPVARALAAEGPVLHDASGKKVLGPSQLKSMEKAVSNLAARRLTLKMLVLKPGAAADTEARRLFTEAALEDDDLLVVGVPGGKVAAYNPTMTPEALREEVADALTAGAEASLPRRMILAATAVGSKLQAPPELPETPAPSPPPPGPTAPPVPLPPESGPAPWLWAGVGAGGAIAALLLWAGIRRLLARRRLASGFGLASPQLAVLADALTDTLRELLRKPDRRAAAAHSMAELAFAEASSMMGNAAQDDLGDIARVERAVRLLDEARTRLDDAKAALAEAPERPGGASYLCYFTGRPLADRYDGDLVLLRHGGEERLVLVARAVGERLRRGERPEVRVVEQGGQVRHWAQVPEYDPIYDLYHSERFGRHFVPLGQLPQPFFDDQGRLFATLQERPDYTLDLDRG